MPSIVGVEQARRDRYSRELPEVLAQQRVLLEELRSIGLVSTLEQIISPDTLHLPPTDEERSHMMERIYEKAKTLPAVLPQNESRKLWNAIWDQKWRGRILYPLQREDGSLDPSLRIAIDDQVLVNVLSRNYRVRNLFEIIYTPDRDLIIRGQNERTFTLAEIQDPERPDLVTLDIKFGRSFTHPQRVDPIPDF